jgi:hypothetical protein
VINDGLVVIHRRPRRVLSGWLRDRLRCPGCQGHVRIVRFREKTCRFECTTCKLRFGLEVLALAEAMFKHAEDYTREADIVMAMLDDPGLIEKATGGREHDGLKVVHARIRAEAVNLVKEAQSPGRLRSLIEETA